MINNAVNINLSLVPKKVNRYYGPSFPYRKNIAKPQKPRKPLASDFMLKTDTDTVLIKGKIMSLSKGPGGVLLLKDPKPSKCNVIAFNQAKLDYKINIKKYNLDMIKYKKAVEADIKRVKKEKASFKERNLQHSAACREQYIIQNYNALLKIKQKINSLKNAK